LGHNCIEILSNNKATPRIGGKKNKIKRKRKEKPNKTEITKKRFRLRSGKSERQWDFFVLVAKWKRS